MVIHQDYDYQITDDSAYYNYRSDESISNWKKAKQVNFAIDEFDKVNLSVLIHNKHKQVNKDLVILAVMSGIFFILLIYGFIFTLYYYRSQKKLDELKADFINNMTHEFKTPISTVSISSDILLRPEVNTMPEKIIRYAKIISAENHRLENQVNRVLQISRLDKGVLKLDMEKIDVHQIIQDIINTYSVNINERGGQINTNFYPKKLIILADKMHLTNIIFNLLDNANKYAKEKPIIAISTNIVEEKLCISIKDNGIGIKKDKQTKIFEKFFRIQHGDIHNVKGFGLGLYYVKMITELMGGEIKLNSQINKGTEIKLYFAI